MADSPSLGTVYPDSTRLIVTLILAGAFWLLVPRHPSRPLAKALTGVIAAIWLIGANLVWAKEGPDQLRFGWYLTSTVGTNLLLLAALGILCAAGALRCFADGRPRAGWLLGVFYLCLFAFWSAAVRYAVFLAVIALTVGVGALILASRPTDGPGSGSAAGEPRPQRWSMTLLTMASPVLSALAFFCWLEVGPQTWSDLPCELPGWSLLAWPPLLAIPAGMAWVRSRRAGRSRGAAAAAVVVAGAAAFGLGLIAFFFWFGLNLCGE